MHARRQRNRIRRRELEDMAQNPYYPGYPGQPPAGYAQPPAGYAPPPAGYAQPPAGYAQPPAGYAQPPAGYAQPQAGYAQPPAGYAQPPAAGWYGPPATGATPAPPAYSAVAAESRAHFFVVSRLNRLVLTVEGASNAPGTRVIMQARNSIEGASHQMWYEDRTSGTIRNRMTDFCLDMAAGNCLIVNPYVPGKGDQQWRLAGEKVESGATASKGLDIAGVNGSPGARVGSWEYRGATHQKWDFEVIPPQLSTLVQYASPQKTKPAAQQAKPRRYFFIRSLLNGKSMDISGQSRAPGTAVILWPRKTGKPDNQLWYQDDNGIIRSKMHDYAFDGCGGKITMEPYHRQKKTQQWTVNGQLVQNATNKKRVLDIKAGNMADGAEVIPYDHHGGKNQQWAFDYV